MRARHLRRVGGGTFQKKRMMMTMMTMTQTNNTNQNSALAPPPLERASLVAADVDAVRRAPAELVRSAFSDGAIDALREGLCGPYALVLVCKEDGRTVVVDPTPPSAETLAEFHGKAARVGRIVRIAVEEKGVELRETGEEVFALAAAALAANASSYTRAAFRTEVWAELKAWLIAERGYTAEEFELAELQAKETLLEPAADAVLSAKASSLAAAVAAKA